MSERFVAGKWFVIGVIAAAALTYGQIMTTGDVSGLLHVGETSELRTTIEAELGDIYLAPGPGHDGQVFYAIALDLRGTDIPPLLDEDPAYRYRRILFPALASAFGLLDGEALLISMILVNILSVGVAAASTAVLTYRRGWSDWFALAVILNPGVWLSVIILTGDAISLALMLLGLLFVQSRRSAGTIAFAGSVLAKEVAMLTPLGLFSYKRRSTWPPVVVSATALSVWVLWLTATMGAGYTPRGTISLPFLGIADSSAGWGALPADEKFFLGFALLSVLAGLIAGALRPGPLRWPVLLWAAVGAISSSWVWDFGNNAARVLAPLAVLIALHLTDPLSPNSDPLQPPGP